MSISLTLLLLITTISTTATATATAIGVTYIPSHSQPPPEKVITTLKSLKITSIRLPEPDPSLIRSFFYTNISILIYIPNTLLPSIAKNRSVASLWLYSHVALISSISVGNNFIGNPTSGDILVNAVRNVYQSLHDLGIRKITVSTTLSFVNIMKTAFPPSSAEFEEPVNNVTLKPFLQFLSEKNSSFFFNLYPYFVFKLRPEIPVGFAMFEQQIYNFRDDSITGVRYRNLFDLMVDAVIAAMTISGHENIPLVVTETGWPGSGLLNEADANPLYAEIYLQGLIYHLRSGYGSPLRKEGVKEAYIYELFDTNTTFTNQVATRVGTGQNWGLLYHNMSKKFEFDFSGGFRLTEGILAKLVALGLLSLVIGLFI